MHIGIVTQRFITGDGQGYINYSVAQAALDRGHSLILIGLEIDPSLRDHPNVTWVPIAVPALPTQLLRDQAFAWRSRREIDALRDTLDLLLVNGAITWSRSDINAIHFVHDAWRRSPAREDDARSGLHNWYHALYTAVNTAWERWTLRRTQHVVAVSSLVKAQVEALDLDVPISVIPNGIDPTQFSPEGPAVDRTEIGCPLDAPLGLFVGDIRTSLKNLDTVLRALRAVPSLHLAVAGSLEGSPFPTLAVELGVEDRVHFLDFRRDIPALMRTADLLVFPSRYETFSLVVLEAMASGLPVITARTVGAADCLTPESGIVLDDPNDEEALVGALRMLVANPNRRREMGRAARLVAEDYHIRTTAERYVDLFETLEPEPSSSPSHATAVSTVSP